MNPNMIPVRELAILLVCISVTHAFVIGSPAGVSSHIVSPTGILNKISSHTGILNLKTCCDDIEKGFCFPENGILKSLLSMLRVRPQCPSTFSPTFTLFTRALPTSGVSISKDEIPEAFTNNRRTAFLVHGWQDSFDSNFIKMKDELLKKDDLNVIGVDWKTGASSITYIPSAANTASVGALIGATVNALRDQPGSNPYFYCIGHSLGAHICGFTKLTAKPLLDRITGLDPAGPYFTKDEGLTRDCASKVDIIHTDILLGSINPRGHVDFYPNGGKLQPNCPDPGQGLAQMTDLQKILKFQVPVLRSVAEGAITSTIACSHMMAITYMTNSIGHSSCYVAKSTCGNFLTIPVACSPIPSTEQSGVMGYDAINHRYNGYLYLTTNLSPQCAAR